ncbi:hypothetical protein GGI00_000845 [Coemansia sp. RSA 2681]|nr:hypothetical protein GGI00_000845 [Coemansia sp. RSA 2681]
MEGLSGKELDDSIFGTDSHLDWAEEVNTLEALNDNRFSSSATKADESSRQRRASPPPSLRPVAQDSRRRGSRGDTGRDARTMARRPQNDRPQNDRPPRPDSRPTKASAESSNYSRSASRGEYNAGRGSSRPRGARSVSRVGGPGPPSQGYSQSSGINIRSARNTRDRSQSMERPGSLDQGRGWRGPQSMGRSRADNVDRWEHDKFEGTSSAPSTSQPAAKEYVRDRRHSGAAAVQSTGPLPADVEYIGKEGISHVTINRRESNASSSRGYPSASYEAPRRQLPDFSAPPLPTSDEAAGASAHASKASASPVAPSSGGGVRPTTPRLPGSNEPYRAPHRRQSSVDTTSPPPLPLPLPTAAAVAAAAPLLIPQDSVLKTTLPPKPAIGEADEVPDEASSAEMEWENFVANGGLDLPIDRITDDLLKHPRSRSQSVFSPAEVPRSAHEQRREPPIADARMGGSGLERAHDRAALLLNNDGDDDDDDIEVGRNAHRPDSSYDKSEGEGEGEGEVEQKGVSIRGSAPKAQPVAAISHLENSMASLALNQVAAPRASRPSIPERTPRKGSAPAQQQQPRPQPSDADSLGIRIKGSSAKLPASPAAANGRASAPADARTPSRPTPSAAGGGGGARAATPTKPVSPSANRSVSRSSSGDEGRAAAQGSTPSSYLRRQFEVYDESRGRHLFSVNIPYDEGRYAPIHIHERDDLPKLAAKFARTWRVHNKEQRIKLLLTKVQALIQDSSL